MKIFISHSVKNDEDIARELRTHLTTLSKNTVESLICQTIPGGKKWREWIDNSLGQADVLVVIYSSEQQDLEWITYEAGMFQGRNKDAPVILLKNQPLSKVPDQFSELQFYDSDNKGLERFFTDLLYRGAFSDGERINEQLLEETFKDALNNAAAELAKKFELRQIKVDYFERRLDIPMVDGRPDGAQVYGDHYTFDLLKLARNSQTWDEISNRFKERHIKWVTELERSVEMIRSGQTPQRLMTPFELQSGAKCFPILSKVKRRRNTPVSLSVMFVESEPELEKDEQETKAPARFHTVMSMLNIARRVRWNIIENYLGILVRPMNDDSLNAIGTKLIQALERIEDEAEQRGYLIPGRVKAALPVAQHKIIDELFTKYYECKENLTRAIQDKDQSRIVEVLKTLQEQNKKFLLLVLRTYSNLIDTLEPTDLRIEKVSDQEETENFKAQSA